MKSIRLGFSAAKMVLAEKSRYRTATATLANSSWPQAAHGHANCMGSLTNDVVKQDSSDISSLHGASKKCAITLAFGCCSSTAVIAKVDRQGVQMHLNSWLQLKSILAGGFVVVPAVCWSLQLFTFAEVFWNLRSKKSSVVQLKRPPPVGVLAIQMTGGLTPLEAHGSGAGAST
jgi:hypothetical protein